MALDLSALDGGDEPATGPVTGVAGRASLTDFVDDPDNPRFEADEEAFDSLVADIRERGILQPIVVRRVEDGQLKIRFGSRRYRAAKQIGLSEVPYIITEDERQFDDYAQVSENERRHPLQPLELARFIDKKLAAGSKKKEIAARLGLQPSALTYLLALVEDAPSFILDLYHSRRCRSPQYLYELRRMWEAEPLVVESYCAGTGAVDRLLLSQIVEATKVTGHSTDKREPALAADVAPSPPTETCDAGIAAEKLSADESASRVRGRTIHIEDVTQLKVPELLATYCGRKVTIVLNRLPSRDGKIVIVDPCGEFREVPIHAVRLTRLCEAGS